MMRRIDGNSILIITGDEKYGDELCDVLRTSGASSIAVFSVQDSIRTLSEFDFDVVISSYCLPDGLIHHITDWASVNLEFLPIFMAIDSGIPGEESLLRRHLISEVFSKFLENESILKKVQCVLFDFNKFYANILSMIDPKGITLELIVNGLKTEVYPVELLNDGIFVSLDKGYDMGTSCLLRIIFFENEIVENFTLLGLLTGQMNGCQFFKIDPNYETTWKHVQRKFEEKQVRISGFLSKAAGN